MDEDTLNKGTSTLRSECSEALQESLISNALRDLGISKDEIPLLNEAFDLYEKKLRGPAMLLLCEDPYVITDRNGGEYKVACETCRTCIKMNDFLGMAEP